MLATLVIDLNDSSESQILATMAEGNQLQGIHYIYAGRIISGISIGSISAVSPAYISECFPQCARGRVTGVLTIGSMVSYFVNRKLTPLLQSMSYSIYSQSWIALGE